MENKTFGVSVVGIELVSALGTAFGELAAAFNLDVKFLVLNPCLLYIPIENIWFSGSSLKSGSDFQQ